MKTPKIIDLQHPILTPLKEDVWRAMQRVTPQEGNPIGMTIIPHGTNTPLDKDIPQIAKIGSNIFKDNPPIAQIGSKIVKDNPPITQTGSKIIKDDPPIAQTGSKIVKDDPLIAKIGIPIKVVDPHKGKATMRNSLEIPKTDPKMTEAGPDRGQTGITTL